MTRARANTVLVVVVTAAVLAGLVGCGEVAARRAEGEAEAERARLTMRLESEAVKARLAERFEVLEARLLEGRARVQAWGELRDRRERVAAEADRNAAWRVSDVLRAREAEQLLVRAIRAPRLAAAGVVVRGTGSP